MGQLLVSVPITAKDSSSLTSPLHHLVSLSLSTAGYDYTPGPYTVSFTAGQLYATLMVSTIDDSTTELAEYFSVAITSTDPPSVVEIGAPNRTVTTIQDNDPGINLMCTV